MSVASLSRPAGIECAASDILAASSQTAEPAVALRGGPAPQGVARALPGGADQGLLAGAGPGAADASAAAYRGLSLGASGDQAAVSAFAATFSQMKAGPLSHFDSQLSALYLQQSPSGADTLSARAQQFSGAFSLGPDGRQYVTVDCTAADGKGGAMLRDLQDIGMLDGSSFGAMVSGRIAVDNLDALARLGNLAFARESAMTTYAGLVQSQADIAQRSDVARHDFRVNGSGLSVGVLSDSFDGSFSFDPVTGRRDDVDYNIRNGDLPRDTTILQDIASGSDEGRAMAQLIHDIAPKAAIQFATAFTGQAGFANNILALAENGSDVIVDDVIYFAELAYQEGIISQAIDQAVAGGATYFTSAGNNAREGLEQRWSPGGLFEFDGVSERLMEFENGQDYLRLDIGARSSAILVLQWDEPGASAGGLGSSSDLDLFITNRSGSTVYTASTANNIGADPVEIVGLSGHKQGQTYYIRVGLFDGPAPTEIKLVALGNGAAVDLATTSGNFNSGTIYGHAGNSDAISVGAVRYDATPEWRVTLPIPEPFTSLGPSRVWFDENGNRLSAPLDNLTPQISAVDGVNTTFFGFDYDLDGHPNFFGTSAAAPNAAAVALLMLEANGNLNAQDIENLLMDSAIDMDDPVTPGFDRGTDNLTGAGLIQADAAVRFADTLVISNDNTRALYGTHLDDVIQSGQWSQLLFGGGGRDSFQYDSVYDSQFVRPDTIMDLDDGDTIDVALVDASEGRSGNQSFRIVDSFDGHGRELIITYHEADASGDPYAGLTTFEFHTNRDGIPDMLILARGDHGDFDNFAL